MIKAHLIFAIICYGLASIFGFIILFHSNLKVYWNKIRFLLLLGFAVHTITLMLYWQAKQHFPIISNIEALFFVSWLLVPLMLIVEYKRKDITMSSILLPFVLIALIIMLTADAPIAVLSPKLRSSWMYLHVPASLLGFIFLFVSTGCSFMYIMQERAMKNKKMGWFYDKLPSLPTCESLSYNSLVVGFLLMTIGIISGMFWAKTGFGKFWQWDVKEILSGFTWLTYAILLYNRLTMKWTGKLAAYFAIIAFILVLITFFGFSIISKSYHAL